MLKALAQVLHTEKLLKTDDHVVVAVSGGADSMALLHLLIGLNRQEGWSLRLHVAHLNHRLRGEAAEQDAAFVQAISDDLALPCTIEVRDVARAARERAAGLEEVGREERYAFLERVCLHTTARIVATGHHADDNAETILQRILRGTGLRGLCGIPRQRPIHPMSDVILVRPLLRFRRGELRKYLLDQGIGFREDATNAQLEPTRNRLRHELIPRIEETVNPQVRDALLRLGEQAQWFDEYLSDTVQRTFETLVISHTDQSLILNADVMTRKNRLVRTELIRMAYRAFGLGEQNLSFTHLVSAMELLDDPTSGKQVQLPGGMVVEKRYHQLVFSLPSEEARETIAAEIAVHVPGKTIMPMRRMELECTVREAAPANIPDLRRAAGRLEEYVDFDAVHLPLSLRPRRPGDRFVPLGAPGSKKVSEFLIDAKVEPAARRQVLLLCDRLGPIWLVGHRIDDRVKLTALTRNVLGLRMRMLDA